MRVGGRGLGRNGLNVLVVSVAVNLGPALHRGLYHRALSLIPLLLTEVLCHHPISPSTGISHRRLAAPAHCRLRRRR
ncbi:hypothetical protein ACFX2J_035171 [Malus domestica]